MKIPKPKCVKQLESGPANSVWLLQSSERSLIFKWLTYNDDLGLQRHREFELQQLLAQRGIAPKVVALDSERWVLQEYIEAPSLAAYEGDWDDKLAYLAAALAQVHQQQVAWNGDTLWQKLERYAPQLDAAYTKQLARFKSQLGTTSTPVLCHFDLSFENVLASDKPLIIDWEYAGWGDRLADIASSIEINQFSDESVAALCRHYAAITGYAIEAEKLAQYRQLVRWINAQWYRIVQQQGASTNVSKANVFKQNYRTSL